MKINPLHYPVQQITIANGAKDGGEVHPTKMHCGFQWNFHGDIESLTTFYWDAIHLGKCSSAPFLTLSAVR